MIVFNFSDIWPKLTTEPFLQNKSHIVWCPTGMSSDKNTLEGLLICCISFLVFLRMATSVHVFPLVSHVQLATMTTTVAV